MSRKTRTLAIAAVSAVMLVGSFSSVSQAVDPGNGGGRRQPLLGFVGRMQYGYGMEVQRVNWNSLAQRMGLERGDVIVRINGQQIRTTQDYYSALRWSGGRLTVVVDDCWGRGYITVYAELDNGAGPSGIRCRKK